jgi:hypothetical protein
MQAKDTLILKAADLARSSPNRWAEFVAAFRAYGDVAKDECVKAPLDELQRAQGRAQSTASMVTLLEGVVKTADHILESERVRRQGRGGAP